jgi:Tfp pilus assembly protein PilP
MRSVMILASGILLTVAAICSHAQGQPAAKPSTAPGTATAAPANAKPAAKPVAKTAKTAKPAVKPTVKPVSKERVSAVSAEKKPGAEGQAARPARRDPFESLLGRQKNAGEAGKNLPPGKGGLQVGTLRVDGIVHAPNGMIAVVTNPQQRTYFLHEGDQLYDGRVEKIAMDGVSFHETGKDAFGKPVERQVTKRIYSNAGEEQ